MLKRETKGQYYYHVTDHLIKSDSNNKVLFKPLSNDRADGRGLDEPTLTRTCVAPSIAHCLTAIVHNFPVKKYFVYKTKNRVKAYCPYDVHDSKITKEKWLLSPILFELHGIFYPYDVEPIEQRSMGHWISYSYFKNLRKFLKLIQKTLNNEVMNQIKQNAKKLLDNSLISC